jgi:hypothetical protein
MNSIDHVRIVSIEPVAMGPGVPAQFHVVFKGALGEGSTTMDAKRLHELGLIQAFKSQRLITHPCRRWER